MMYENRHYRKPYRNSLGGLAAGIFMMLGALAAPVMGGLSRGFPPVYPPYQPGQPYQPYQPYQQGDQPPQQAVGTPQESEQQREYTQQPK